MATNVTESELTHWRKIDFREDSLYEVIEGLEHAITSLKKKLREIHWYDGDWFAGDAEPIYGLAFIAFQNYINGSITDLYETADNKIIHYKIEPNLKHFNKTSIELIIGLANFTKHKDEGKLQKGTKDILDCFNLTYFPEDIYDEVDKSPIFEGLSLLNEEWDLFEILKIVTNWRKKLFDNFIENYQTIE